VDDLIGRNIFDSYSGAEGSLLFSQPQCGNAHRIVIADNFNDLSLFEHDGFAEHTGVKIDRSVSNE
jgi:hypothetical protein